MINDVSDILDVHLISNGVDTNHFAKQMAIKYREEKYNIPNATLLLTVAALEKEKLSNLLYHQWIG